MRKYKNATLIKYIGLAILSNHYSGSLCHEPHHNGLMGLFTGLLLYSFFFLDRKIQNARRDLRLSKEEYHKIDYKTGLMI